MKKVLYAVLIAVLLILGGIYIFIPKNLKISSAIIYNANREGVFHFLVEDSNWAKWWPGEILNDDNGKKVFAFSGYDYRVQKNIMDNGQCIMQAVRIYMIISRR